MCSLDGIIDSMDISLSKLQETVKVREAWRGAPFWFCYLGNVSLVECISILHSLLFKFFEDFEKDQY